MAEWFGVFDIRILDIVDCASKERIINFEVDSAFSINLSFLDVKYLLK